jgi:ABC-type transport system substrate-binding protein
LAACGGGSSTGSSTSSGAGTSSATPKPGGKLIVGLDSEFSGFDPTQGRWDSSGVMRGRTVYDPLAAIAADGTTKPYLAQSITPNSDYTKWTITMRPNIVFHNGTALDANVVKINLDALRASALAGPAYTNIASVDVTDPMTVVVSMKAPWVPFPASINGLYQGGYIAEPSTLQNGTAQTKPIGTGPFVFQEWIPNDHFTATKNPHYWRSGMPYLDSIEYRPIPDFQSRENSLKSGTVDIIHSADLQNYVDLINNSSFVSITDLHSQVVEPNMTFFQINTAAPPLDDVRVRQALAYATDRQQYINVIDQGVPPQSTGPFVPGSPYYGDTGYPSFNLSKAQQLVNQYKADHGGQPPSFTLLTTTTPKDLERTQLVQATWQKAGMQVPISQIEQSQQILNALLGKYQVTTWGQYASADPDFNQIWWNSSTASPIGSLALNFARNKDPQIDQNLSNGRTSTDPSARATAYQNVAKRFAQDIPYLWLDREVWIYAAKPSVMNFAGGTLPDGTKAIPLIWGQIWPTQIWLNR